MRNIRVFKMLISFLVVLSMAQAGLAMTVLNKPEREERRKQEIDETQKEFNWWPTDAQPAPVKDDEHSGYWWWPNQPGSKTPWGNRGYVYVYKIIFDYQADELPPPKAQELRPSLLIKKIVKNVKVYFDYDKSVLRDDTRKILNQAVGTLERNPETSILITGNCDIRGSETYNDKLGRQRAAQVKEFMITSGIPEERIKIVSRGKLDAVAPISDLVGMQKDRNAQFMIAEVEEIMLPFAGEPVSDEVEIQKVEDGKYLVELESSVEGEIRVETKDYVIRKGDTLWKIAERELGNGHRWKNLYELNKKKISNPDKLKSGITILIPVE